MKDKKIIVIISSIVLLGGFVAAAFFYKQSIAKKHAFLALENAEVFVRPHSPAMGPKDAPVYLVEFLDPECESCRAFYPAVKQIMKEFEGKIRLVVRYVPFHSNSKNAIAILIAAKKQNKYWETLEHVFKTQPIWGDHHNPQPQKLWESLPAIQGINMEHMKEDLNSPEIAKIIERDLTDAKQLGVRQTPTFFVNGKRLERFGYEPLRELIKGQL